MKLLSSCKMQALIYLQYGAASHPGADRIVKDNLCVLQIIKVSVYREIMDGIFF